jgi:hypothetical protein
MDMRQWWRTRHLVDTHQRERPMTITLPQLKCLQRESDPPTAPKPATPPAAAGDGKTGQRDKGH